MKSNQFLAVVGVATLTVYSVIVFCGYALMFGLYQFLRDHGYGFWQSCGVLTAVAAALTVPAIVRRVYK